MGLRCWRCRQIAPLCVCQLLQTFDHPTRLALVLHRGEAFKPTNTGHLATRCLRGSQRLITGQGAPLQLIAGRAAVLFPSDDAVELSPTTAPEVLVVPDGTWPQAKRLVKRDPLLQGLPRVKLPNAIAVGHRLRRNPRPDGLMTLEAIAVAYGAMGAPEIERTLLDLFRVVAERTLYMRGQLAADQVTGGVPRGFSTENISAKWRGPVQLCVGQPKVMV